MSRSKRAYRQPVRWKPNAAYADAVMENVRNAIPDDLVDGRPPQPDVNDLPAYAVVYEQKQYDDLPPFGAFAEYPLRLTTVPPGAQSVILVSGSNLITLIHACQCGIPLKNLEEEAIRMAKKNEEDLALMQQRISERLSQIMYWHQQSPPVTNDEVADRVADFFDKCVADSEVPTVEKLCIALGMTPAEFRSVELGERGEICAAILQRAKQIIAALDAEMVNAGDIPVVSYIFRAKNFYGMADQQQLVVLPRSPFETADVGVIAERYGASQIQNTSPSALLAAMSEEDDD